MSKKHKSEAEKAKQRRHTAENKIKRIQKALLTAGGQAKGFLQQRLEFWQRQL